jgi:hypothetical protein
VNGSEENLVDKKVCLPKPGFAVSLLMFAVQKGSFSGLFCVTSFHRRSDESDYVVKQLADHDDGDHLSRPRQILHKFSPAFVFLAMGAYFVYYAFRVHCIIAAQNAYKEIHVMAWLFVTAEALVACEYDERCKHGQNLLIELQSQLFFTTYIRYWQSVAESGLN